MAYLDEIVTIIEAGTTEAGSGSIWPIFTGHLPDSTVIGNRAVALLASPGEGDEERVDIENPGLQVIVRGRSQLQDSSCYQDAAAVAQAVKNALAGFTGESSSGGTHYPGIWNESGPFFIGFDSERRPKFSTNLRVVRSRT